MPEPFKNSFNKQVITGMADHFKNQWSEFNHQGFIRSATKNLTGLELKERSNQIMESMVEYLPANFEQAGKIILKSLSPAKEGDIFGITVDEKGIAGWVIMPMADFVGIHGHKHFDLSMTLLKEMTKRFSSEFGIRYFLLKDTDKTLTTLKSWLHDDDKHVRRLISEGIRPRLPWAMQLPQFINDPTPVIELLEYLKDDQEEYVRRSVANNLNDIAKDHPDVVSNIAEQWMKGASVNRKKLIRHACRTLIKNKHIKTLNTLGFKNPKIKLSQLEILNPNIKLGEQLEFSLKLQSNSAQEQALMIDFIIHHQKANGKTTPKVFKWCEKKLAAKQLLCITKNHPIKKITTRKYYPGLHKIEVVINGVSLEISEFQLHIPEQTIS